MFDIGWSEFFLIAVVALVVLGPKDLPKAMRMVARLIGKARGLSREFQENVNEMMREAELDELRRKVEAMTRADVKSSVRDIVDPDGRLSADFDPDEFRYRGKDAAAPAAPHVPSAPGPAAPPLPAEPTASAATPVADFTAEARPAEPAPPRPT